MLATDKISGAFKAIVEETEKLLKKEKSDKRKKTLKNIISIAKHQSDVRGAKAGSCCGHGKSEGKCHGHEKDSKGKEGGCCSSKKSHKKD